MAKYKINYSRLLESKDFVLTEEFMRCVKNI